MRRLTLLVGVLTVVAGMAGCGDDGATATETTGAPTTEATTPAEDPATTEGEAPAEPATTTTTTEPETEAPAPPPETTPGVTNPPQTGGPVLATDVFEDGGEIPIAFTCHGANDVPGLRFDLIPDGTTSLALTVIDPDGGDWIHWVAWNIPPDAAFLGPEVPPGDLPDGTRQGANDYVRGFSAGDLFPGGGEVRIDGWDGPCPPPGGPHRYVFTLYALTGTIDLPSGTPGADIQAAIENARRDGSLIGEATITGFYPAG